MPLYRSRIHSPLEANPIKYRADNLSPLDANPIKYRSRGHSPLIWSPPHVGDLVGWYKVDEGSGSIVHNSANPVNQPNQKWPDLTIQINPTGFWNTKPGYGSSFPGGRSYAEYRNAGSSLTSTAIDSWALFLFRVGFDQGYPISFGVASSISSTVTPKTYHEFYATDSEYHLDDHVYSRMGSAISPNDWKFIFGINTGGTNNMKGYQVNSDGTLIPFTFLGGGNGVSNYLRIRLLMDYSPGGTVDSYIYGSLADVMYYRNVSLTLGDWRDIYDTLHGRYLMASRSGW